MKKNRFYWTRSTVYGIAVYDRITQMPAYGAVGYLSNCEDVVMIESEYKAMALCSKLNRMLRIYVNNGYMNEDTPLL